MSLRRVAPTLAAPTARALLGGLRGWIAPQSVHGTLERELAVFLPAASVLTFGSGRAALAAALRAAMRATGRHRVVVPAFTSYSVAAAAAAAGAAVELCDLDPVTLQLDRAALRSCVGPDTAAVVLGNVYGHPDVTSDLAWLAGEGVVVVDDAAQALGAREAGRAVGTRGGLGVLSFGRGKCVSLGDGGALLVSDTALAAAVMAERREGTWRAPRRWLAAVATALSRDPRIFGLLSRLPGLRIGESWYDPDFASAPLPSVSHGLALGLALEVERQRGLRTACARRWLAALDGVAGVAMPPVAPGAESAWLRLPVLASGPDSREAMVACLARAGLTFVRTFPTTLASVPAFRACVVADRPVPGAARVARCLLTLPCHAAVSERDVQRGAAAVRRAVSGRLHPAE